MVEGVFELNALLLKIQQLLGEVLALLILSDLFVNTFVQLVGSLQFGRHAIHDLHESTDELLLLVLVINGL